MQATAARNEHGSGNDKARALFMFAAPTLLCVQRAAARMSPHQLQRALLWHAAGSHVLHHRQRCLAASTAGSSSKHHSTGSVE